MNFINIFYVVWVFNGVKKRVFESSWDMVHKIVLEVAIQVFLLACVFFWLNRNGDFLSTTASIILQMLCVLAVLVSILYEFITLIIGLYGCKNVFEIALLMINSDERRLEEKNPYETQNSACFDQSDNHQ